MGWNLYRVWSTEWMRNPTAEGESLLAFLHSVVGKDGKVRYAMKNSNDGSTGVAIEQIASETAKVVQKNPSVNPYGFAYYKEAKWWDTPRSGSNDNLTRISENVKQIVSVEQPIHMELLYKRMGPSFTAGKATEGVKNTIVEAINKMLNGQVRIDSDNFIRLLPETPVVRIPERYSSANDEIDRVVHTPVNQVEYSTERDNVPETVQLDTVTLKLIHKSSDDSIDWTEILVSPLPPDESYNQGMWQYYHSMASKILSGDIDAYLQLIYKVNPLDDLLAYGENYEFETDNLSKI